MINDVWIRAAVLLALTFKYRAILGFLLKISREKHNKK
jgi:hypothetical protein